MLPASTRYKLHFGPYRTPRFKLGALVEDEIRGEVTVVGMTDARIPWPIGRKGKYRALLVDATLAKAIRSESVQAVAYWWGISVETVRVFRRKLDVPVNNEGSSRLRKRYAQTPEFRRAARKAWANAGSPERRAKVAAANLGKKRPASVGRKIAAANRGRNATPETRRRMAAAAKRLWALASPVERRWTAEEIALLAELTNREVAARTGRTIKAVYHQRKRLGMDRHPTITARHTPQNVRGAS